MLQTLFITKHSAATNFIHKQKHSAIIMYKIIHSFTGAMEIISQSFVFAPHKNALGMNVKNSC